MCTDDGGSYIGTKEACDENRETICNSVPGYYGAGRCKSIAEIGTIGSTLPSDYDGNEGDNGVARPHGCYVKENGDLWFNPNPSTEPCSVDRKCLCKKTCQADTCKPKPFDVTCASQIVDNKAICTKTECCNIIGLPVITHFVIKESQNLGCGTLTNGFQVDNIDDCGKGSAAVGWSDTTPTVVDILQNGDVRYQPPPGCYFKGNGDANEKLFFLPSDSKGSCSAGEACLCWVGEVCSNTEGASVNPNTDCMCGTKICDADTGRFCRCVPLRKDSEFFSFLFLFSMKNSLISKNHINIWNCMTWIFRIEQNILFAFFNHKDLSSDSGKIVCTCFFEPGEAEVIANSSNSSGTGLEIPPPAVSGPAKDSSMKSEVTTPASALAETEVANKTNSSLVKITKRYRTVLVKISWTKIRIP